MNRTFRLALAAPLFLALAAAGPEDQPRQSDGIVMPGTGPGTSAAGGPADVGIQRAASKADAEGRSKLAPAGFLATDVIGIKVSNNAGNALGTVVDLVMVDGRSLSAVVLDVGGFLGVGSRYVAVQPAALILSPGGERYTATLDMSKEQLGAAPDFKYGKMIRQDEDRKTVISQPLAAAGRGCRLPCPSVLRAPKSVFKDVADGQAWL